MKNYSNVFRTSLLVSTAILMVSFTACKEDDDEPTPIDNTIAGIVSSSPEFSTLEAAVGKADLDEILRGAGPFTVFAPSNEAFENSGITPGVLGSLSQDAAKDILLYHTLPSKIMASEVPEGPNAEVAAVNGDMLYVTKNSNGVFVNGWKVIQADVAASNGVVHVIERVLMPASGNIVEIAQADTTFSFLVAAAVKADLASTLSGAGPFTVFAPTNDAFREAGFPTVASVQEADAATLASILTYHAVAGRVFSSDLTDGAQPATVNGGKVTIGLNDGATVKGNGNTTASNITSANILAENGVIHVIDRVLLP